MAPGRVGVEGKGKGKDGGKQKEKERKRKGGEKGKGALSSDTRGVVSYTSIDSAMQRCLTFFTRHRLFSAEFRRKGDK